MFLLPLLAFPFLLAVAAYRLYVLPRRYMSGTLQMAQGTSKPISLLTGLAYLGLLAYTVCLVLLACKLALSSPTSIAEWLAVAPAFAGYPVAYIAAEWVFYYGFRRPPKQAK